MSAELTHASEGGGGGAGHGRIVTADDAGEGAGDRCVALEFDGAFGGLVRCDDLPGSGHGEGVAGGLTHADLGIGEGAVNEIGRFGELHPRERPDCVDACGGVGFAGGEDALELGDGGGPAHREFGDGPLAQPVFGSGEKMRDLLGGELLPVRVGRRFVRSVFLRDTVDRAGDPRFRDLRGGAAVAEPASRVDDEEIAVPIL